MLAIIVSGTIAGAQTIIDAQGQIRKISGPVHRLVSLNADALEVVRLLDARELVVGINRWVCRNSEFWPELKKRPVAGDWNQPNYKKIVALKPDLILTYGRNPGRELEAKLERLGIRVLPARCWFWSPTAGPTGEQDGQTLSGRLLPWPMPSDVKGRFKALSWMLKRTAWSVSAWPGNSPTILGHATPESKS